METHLSNTGAIEFITFQHFRSLIVTGGSPWTLYQYDNYQVHISSKDPLSKLLGAFLRISSNPILMDTLRYLIPTACKALSKSELRQLKRYQSFSFITRIIMFYHLQLNSKSFKLLLHLHGLHRCTDGQ